MCPGSSVLPHGAQAAEGSGIPPELFRQALGHFVTGVTIITTASPDGQPVGMTANAFTAVSLDPPLVLFCVARTAASHAAIEEANRCAVHILHQDQPELASGFARSATDGARKFDLVDWHPGEDGLPLLDDYLGRLECTIIERLPLGDHLACVARVDAAALADGASPLGFFRGRYANVSK